jgi:hypothetical protein
MGDVVVVFGGGVGAEVVAGVAVGMTVGSGLGPGVVLGGRGGGGAAAAAGQVVTRTLCNRCALSPCCVLAITSNLSTCPTRPIRVTSAPRGVTVSALDKSECACDGACDWDAGVCECEVGSWHESALGPGGW